LRYCFFLLLALSAPIRAHANQQLNVGDFSRGADPQGVPRDWQLKEKAGRPYVALVQSDGLHALQLRSTNSSFSLQRQDR
jgi:hypothetical protein